MERNILKVALLFATKIRNTNIFDHSLIIAYEIYLTLNLFRKKNFFGGNFECAWLVIDIELHL